MHKVTCPACKSQASFSPQPNKKIMPKWDGAFYYCNCNGEMKATGARRNNFKPLGILADSETRMFRKIAHKKIEKIIKNSEIKKSTIYKTLTKKIKTSRGARLHIGKMQKEECQEILNQLKKIEKKVCL